MFSDSTKGSPYLRSLEGGCLRTIPCSLHFRTQEHSVLDSVILFHLGLSQQRLLFCAFSISSSWTYLCHHLFCFAIFISSSPTHSVLFLCSLSTLEPAFPLMYIHHSSFFFFSHFLATIWKGCFVRFISSTLYPPPPDLPNLLTLWHVWSGQPSYSSIHSFRSQEERNSCGFNKPRLKQGEDGNACSSPFGVLRRAFFCFSPLSESCVVFSIPAHFFLSLREDLIF